MDCKDLMVGDWVMNACDTPRKVYELVQDQVTYELEGGGLNTAHCNQLYPIPLTEEILVKNGFSEIHHPGTGATDEYSEWFLGGIKITEWLEDWKDHHFSTGGDDCSISFNYVHELQHLLRLCGIEKEIEL